MDKRMVDAQARAQFMASEAGGVRAGARVAKLPYSTFRRIYLGIGEATPENRGQLNRRFRETAPASVRTREKGKKGIGFALVSEAKARKLEASYRKQGLSVKVYARQRVQRSIGGIGDPIDIQSQYTYSSAHSSVDAAKKSIEERLDKLMEEDNYQEDDIIIQGDIQYRVIPQTVVIP